MLRLLLLASSFLPAVAFAHPGHLAAEAGHSHWLALAAFGGAAAVAIVPLAQRLASRRRERRLAHD
jgi:hypothetical protein